MQLSFSFELVKAYNVGSDSIYLLSLQKCWKLH